MRKGDYIQTKTTFDGGGRRRRLRGPGRTARCDAPSDRGLCRSALTLLILAACLGLSSTGCASDDAKAAPKSDSARRTTTTKAETQAERAQRLLGSECKSRYAVPIEVRPSQILPSTSSDDTTVYFFEIYARDTGAFLSNRATWTIRGEQETYGCG